ncbi:PaaI family thioesterase [Camelimonas abortus]|uniref:PaaI family thioesterase n=1 Tax=Camelimonas abortus TaxID=1017184 RepID=A0ABV7LG23_9HYPH
MKITEVTGALEDGAELDPALLDFIRKRMQGGTPHAEALGLTFETARVGHATLALPWQEAFAGDVESGILHGGVITALIDHTCGASVQLKRVMKQAIATLDLRIDYMKPASKGETVRCHAHCYKMTKNIAFVRAEAYQGESDLIANAVATFMLAANNTTLAARPDRQKLGEIPVRPPAPPATPDSPAQKMLERMSYARFLGVECEQKGEEVTATLRFEPRLIGNPSLPALHGGAIGAFLETTALLQLSAQFGQNRPPKPIGLTINYLRSGRPVDTYGRCRITKAGRRVVSVMVEAWQEDPDRPIASAYGHFLLRQED